MPKQKKEKGMEKLRKKGKKGNKEKEIQTGWEK